MAFPGSQPFGCKSSGIWSSASTRPSQNSSFQNSHSQQPIFFSSEECCFTRGSLRHASQESHSKSQGSVIPRLLQQTVPCSQENRRLETSNRFEQSKSFSGFSNFSDGNFPVHQELPSSRPVDHFSGPQRCLFSCSHGPICSQVAQISSSGHSVSVCRNAFWPCDSPKGIHFLNQGSQETSSQEGHQSTHVLGRLACESQQSSGGTFCHSNSVRTDPQSWLDCQQGKVRSDPKTGLHLSRSSLRPFQRSMLSNRGQVPVNSGSHPSSIEQHQHNSSPSHAPSGSSSFHREASTTGSSAHATSAVSTQETLRLHPDRCTGLSIHLTPFCEGSSEVVVRQEQCHVSGSTSSPQVCNIPLHRCFHSGMGSSLCSYDCSRPLVHSGVQTAHQCPGTQGCSQGSQSFCSLSVPSTKDHSDCLRQYNCLCLHQQTRRYPFMGNVCPNMAPLCPLHQEQGSSCSSAHSRSHESCCRPTLKVQSDHSHRMVSQPSDLQVAISDRLSTPNRSLCNKVQQQTPVVCVPSSRPSGSGNRCSSDELVRSTSVLLPSYSSSTSGSQEVNKLPQLQDVTCSSFLGNQGVVTRSSGSVNKKSSTSSSRRKSSKTTSSRGLSSKSKHTQSSCLLAEVSLERKGFSQEVTKRILSPIRKSSKTVYEAKWNCFKLWCEKHGHSAMHPTIPIIAEFFNHLFTEKNILPQTIEGYRSALSIKLDSDLELGSNKELRRLIQSFYKSKPKASRHLPAWDLSLVLQALTKSPFEPMSQAEPKFLTWKTVFLIALASGRRRSEIHAFTYKGCSHSRGWSQAILKSDPSFLAKNQLASQGSSVFAEVKIPSLSSSLGQDDKEDRSLCPVRALRHYLSRTSDLRQGRSLLFVSLLKSKEGDISAQTISNWIKNLIHYILSNCSTENASLHSIRAHDVRAQAASWSFRGGVPLLDIMKACTWKNHSTFTSFYFRDVSLQNMEGIFSLGDIVAAQQIVSLSS